MVSIGPDVHDAIADLQVLDVVVLKVHDDLGLDPRLAPLAVFARPGDHPELCPGVRVCGRAKESKFA